MNDRYEITRIIVKDYAGGVYEGEDTVLKRKVACRRFFGIDGESENSQWENEFTAFCHKLTSMQHPNLALIYDAGIDEDGAFLVSQFIEGETIGDLLISKAPSEYEVNSLAHDVLEAFTMIHSQHETHGALVPRSVIRVPKPGGRYIHHLIDLGIAGLVPIIQGKPFDAKNPALTAPEQLQGNAPTPQSDLFMLGQLVYTFAAQGHPYSQADRENTIKLHLKGEQPPLNALAPGISNAMSEWVSWLVDPDPSKRPSSADAALRSLPVVAAPVVTTPQATRAQSQKIQTTQLNTVINRPNSTTVALATPPPTSSQAVVNPRSAPQFPATKQSAHQQVKATSPANAPQLLSSAKTFSKTAVICFAAITATTLIVATVWLAQVTSSDETASETTEMTPEIRETEVSIGTSRLVNLNNRSNYKTPKVVELQPKNFDEYVIFDNNGPGKFKKSSSVTYLNGGDRSPGSNFSSFSQTTSPIRFKVDGKTLAPKLATTNKRGAHKGHGYDLEIYIPKEEAAESVEVELYYLQNNCDLNFRLIEQSIDSLEEVELATKNVKCQDSGYYAITFQFQQPRLGSYYRIRMLAGDRKVPSAGLTFGLGAAIVKVQ